MTALSLRPSPDRIIEANRPVRPDAWAALQAELAHDAVLDEARAVVREGATYISPARLDAAIEVLRTGDAYDRFIGEELAGARAQQRARAALYALDDGNPDEGHPAAGAVWIFGAALLILLIGAMILWGGAQRADRPAACEFMTASDCIAWAQEQAGAE